MQDNLDPAQIRKTSALLGIPSDFIRKGFSAGFNCDDNQFFIKHYNASKSRFIGDVLFGNWNNGDFVVS